MKCFGLWLWPTILLRLLLWMMLLSGLAGLVYLCAGACLAWPADQPHRADAVVVLGGGDDARYDSFFAIVLVAGSTWWVWVRCIAVTVSFYLFDSTTCKPDARYRLK